jgi:outer membrane protein assembly factor BamB
MPDAQVYQSADLPDGTGRLVVFDWSARKEYRWRNLVCFDRNGDVAWTAELPEDTGSDCFVGVKVDGGTIWANTWSCYVLTLDPRTGETLSRAFTK